MRENAFFGEKKRKRRSTEIPPKRDSRPVLSYYTRTRTRRLQRSSHRFQMDFSLFSSFSSSFYYYSRNIADERMENPPPAYRFAAAAAAARK